MTIFIDVVLMLVKRRKRLSNFKTVAQRIVSLGSHSPSRRVTRVVVPDIVYYDPITDKLPNVTFNSCSRILCWLRFGGGMSIVRIWPLLQVYSHYVSLTPIIIFEQLQSPKS